MVCALMFIVIVTDSQDVVWESVFFFLNKKIIIKNIQKLSWLKSIQKKKKNIYYITLPGDAHCWESSFV